MKFTLQSPSFIQDGQIPARFSGEGQDVSPELLWSNPPTATREFALICDDPDAPSAEPWVHWLIYNIPGSMRCLEEGVPKEARPSRPAGTAQGLNSWGKTGYGGPMPPPGHGPHRYIFQLLALDEPLELESGASKKELLAATATHVIGKATLVGIYERRVPSREHAEPTGAQPFIP